MANELSNRIAHHVTVAAHERDSLAIASALNSIEPDDLAIFLHEQLTVEDNAQRLGEGLPASPGGASGRIVLTAAEALEAGDAGQSVILVRSETTPDDVLGMQASKGILTCRGGLVSHAAVVARGWGIPAVVGAVEVHIEGTSVTIGSATLQVGDEITIDGSTGAIYRGSMSSFGAEAPPELDVLLGWADDVARGHVQVRVNADTGSDAGHGRDLGAQGIGLCRTEHMFLSSDRLPIMRRFILSHDPRTEGAALRELERAQIADFEQILEVMDDLPVTVRLLDPPLHEFLPNLLDLTAAEARDELDADGLAELAAVRRLHEVNPMLGTRGVRLGMVRPGVYEMQVRALCIAAANLFEQGRNPHVEIMIPLVVDAEELRVARSWVDGVLNKIGHPELAAGVITVGAMIETPRAAITAGALAEHADFFSFGTNDLTQMTFAFSRDDVESKLLPTYQAQGILEANPFAVLDQAGVGEILRHACGEARNHRPDIKLGICGEHAGHPESADFLIRLGVDSVSCSPFRVPIARIAVAQALLACGRVHIDDVEFHFGDKTSRDHTLGAGADAARDVDSMPPVEVDLALVLHVLRIRGFITPDGLEASLGTVPRVILDQLIDAGHVNYMEPRNMYMLMPPGRERHGELLPGLATNAGRLAEPYEQFLTLNDSFKKLCNDWQMRGDQPNDHTDATYDKGCTERLATLDDNSVVIISEMATAVTRLARYTHRLNVARRAVEAGEAKQFTGVMCESYHDIWMELHEDLIVLQGIDRTAEGSF
ncbi:MAG: pyruvate, phosphate dikinase [Actinomycetia bacterium]|nr:pyruvate, phosphate dikinase [Actinomycetes bacterium]MCP4959839.1 pyruvate, phosphate dikinase [Actinomycetes bacterium]